MLKYIDINLYALYKTEKAKDIWMIFSLLADKEKLGFRAKLA